jgi:broad specificity phosphatase PhoE
MRLILVRHGETIENKDHILQGHLPGRLSERGKEQAKDISERLKNEKIDCIYSSGLARASDTAKEIAKHHPNAPLKLVKELSERDIGEFQGKKYKDTGYSRGEIKERFFLRMQGKQPKGSESWKDICRRADVFIHNLLRKHRDGAVILVGHAAINNVIMYIITGKMTEEIAGESILGNASISILEMKGDKGRVVHLLDCGKHSE